MCYFTCKNSLVVHIHNLLRAVLVACIICVRCIYVEIRWFMIIMLSWCYNSYALFCGCQEGNSRAHITEFHITRRCQVEVILFHCVGDY